MDTLNDIISGLKWGKLEPTEAHDRIQKLFSRPSAQRVSGDGVLFCCSICNHEPEMSGDTDDLLKMNFCPSCGSKFEIVETKL